MKHHEVMQVIRAKQRNSLMVEGFLGDSQSFYRAYYRGREKSCEGLAVYRRSTIYIHIGTARELFSHLFRPLYGSRPDISSSRKAPSAS